VGDRSAPAVVLTETRAGEPGGVVRTFCLDRLGLSEIRVPGETLDQVAMRLPPGVYTTFRTYEGNLFLRLDRHLARLEESARLLGHPITVDHERIRRALVEILDRTGFPESRFRVVVSLTSDGQPGDIYISIQPFILWPTSLYETGVRCVTRYLARQEPRAKATGFIGASRCVRHALPPDVHEVLIVDERDRILEGMSSNFFALKDGELHTAGEGVLEGVTRSLVLEIARAMLPVSLEPVTRAEVPALSEAFITSSSREVVPVVVIDDVPVGEGIPGPLAREMLQRYRDRVRQELMPALEEVLVP